MPREPEPEYEVRWYPRGQAPPTKPCLVNLIIFSVILTWFFIFTIIPLFCCVITSTSDRKWVVDISFQVWESPITHDYIWPSIILCWHFITWVFLAIFTVVFFCFSRICVGLYFIIIHEAVWFRLLWGFNLFFMAIAKLIYFIGCSYCVIAYGLFQLTRAIIQSISSCI
jgi:hypothetical protein